MNLDKIEHQLRAAPRPKPPGDLKQKLTAQINRRETAIEAVPTSTRGGARGWLRRWWPVLAPAGLSLACAGVMVSQHLELRAVRRANLSLAQQIADANAHALTNASSSTPRNAASLAAAQATEEEISRLRERAAQLSNSVARLEMLQATNESLRHAAAAASGFTPEELADLASLQVGREKAMAINCVNNLKQIGLAARLWAEDSNGLYPPSFLSMSNELNTAKILICPADTNRIAAKSFWEYTDANTSYELMAPSASVLEPQRVLTRCPIHGHVGLCDGSVQQGVAKNHPEWLIERDGKLYLEPNRP